VNLSIFYLAFFDNSQDTIISVENIDFCPKIYLNSTTHIGITITYAMFGIWG
jgi:hypothetical protein